MRKLGWLCRKGIVFLEISRARNRLRPRREDRRGNEVDRLLEGAKDRVKIARREHRSFLRRIERE